MREILSHMDTYATFISHLIHEFSFENLLCVTEMMQYRTLYAHLFRMDHDNDACIPDLLRLPLHDPLFPQSRIVFNDRFQSRASAQCIEYVVKALLNKYIVTGCELEVNIEFALRRKFETLITDKHFVSQLMSNKREVIMVFDPIIRALMNLMSDSFWRFSLSKDYDKCVAFLDSV